MNEKDAFLSFLSNLTSEKKSLNSLLEVKSGGAYAYYLAPLDNVLRIKEVGGIFPRNFAFGFFDLSSHSIQNRRNINIDINIQGSINRVNLHDCVNLFLNPINDTFYQFRRNAIIRSWGGRYRYQTVVILEIDLYKLFIDNDLYWKVNPINFASPVVSQDQSDSYYNAYPWDKIYEISLTSQKDTRKYQASELIIYSRHIWGTPTIHKNNISRTIVFDEDFKNESDNSEFNSLSNLAIIKQPRTILALADPIHCDKNFCSNLLGLLELGFSVESIVSIMGRLLNVELEIGLNFLDIFSKDQGLNGDIHGLGHTLRVMFWVLLIAEKMKINLINISDQEIKSALFAAFIHDLGRINNSVDPEHGARAAEKYKKHIRMKIAAPFSDRCLEAVQVHSLNKDPVNADYIWQLLKDADALDRGRFAPPESLRGCQFSFLRLSVFSDKLFSNRVMWSSYWLSRVTKYINWADNPCDRFIDTINASLYVASKSSSLSKHQAKTINEIIDQAKILQKLALQKMT